MGLRRSRGLAIALSVMALAPVVVAGDPDAAERQYRAARRLAADGSPEAAAALRKVVELDPEGALADDARLEEALLDRPARWPEDLGRIEEAAARRALELLGRVIDDTPKGDRVAEARYYRALLLLEPLSTYDATRARGDLLAVTSPGSPRAWSNTARYAAAWLLEQQGALDRAADAYGRILVDAPESDASSRARIGAARVALRTGSAGRAAALAQRAVETEADLGGAGVLRELALRAVAPSLETGAGTAVRTTTGLRATAGFAAVESGIVIADPRGATVERRGLDGRQASWSLGEVEALTIDPLGRIYAAAGDRLYRLLPDGATRPLANLGDFAPASALAADAAGRVWVLDRKRGRIGRVDPAADAPVPAWAPPGARLVGLAWDGARVVTVEARERLLLASTVGGTLDATALAGVQKPAAIAADPAGRIAVLDDRDGSVHLYGPDGIERVRIDGRARGITKPQAISLEPGGALAVFDASDGAWVRLP